MQLAAILLSLAALGGVAMVVIRLRGAPYPPMALGGVTLVTMFHLKGQPLPIPLMLGHGLLALTGLGLLLYANYGNP